MRNRWYHVPVLHAPVDEHEHKRVSWLELFYDLIFVAAFIQLGNFLSEEVNAGGFLLFAGHFVPLWIAWAGFTFYANRFDVDDFGHRALVLVQMFAVGAMAITSRDSMSGAPTKYALAFMVAQAIVVALYARSYMTVPESRPYCRFWGTAFAIGTVAFGISALFPEPWCYAWWTVGILGILVAPASRQSRELTNEFPIDQEHLSERFGLLTIIVLGESFVKVLSYLTESYSASPEYLLKGFFNLTITCCLWWIYFDDVAGSKIKHKGRGSWVVWLYAHVPLTLSVTAVGVGVKKAIGYTFGAGPLTDKYRWLLAGSLALALMCVALIDSVTERKNSELSDNQRVIVRAASAMAILLLAQVGASMSSGVFLATMAAICVAQVLFDMMMAPLEETEMIQHAESTADEAARRMARGEDAPRSRTTIESAVRRGAPQHLRRDLYFFFIEGSWTRLLLSFGFLYLFINVVFAALYKLEPMPTTGATDHSFADAFFFSVQTLSSIGYGAISPATAWADTLVTVQAAIGMLFVALATGLMFAKASRPQSAVMFSQPMVISTKHGVPTLMFRVANARGNEVVQADMDLTALIEEISPEGHHMRRLHDLKLSRRRTPLFVLSWLVEHKIDKDSPLHGCDWRDVYMLTVSMTGHDSTYGQTIHARHMYYPDDIRQGHKFVDVLSTLPDGRLMLDLTKFHHTLPDEGTSHPEEQVSWEE